MALKDLRDKVCIVGVGDTPQGSFPEKSGDDLAIDAFANALKDAGLRKDQVDGLYVQASYGNQGDYLKIGGMLGLNPKVGGALQGSGATGCYMVQQAALLLNAGMANYVAVVYATNQKSNRNRFAGAATDLNGVYGLFNPSWMFANAYRRYMYLYGTDESHMGQIAVHQRKYAAMNPKAAQRNTITIEDYLNSRYIAWPLHMYDYCYITDGGHCFILTTAERALDTKKPPVYIRGMGRNEAFASFETPDLLLQTPLQKPVAKMVYEMAGLGPKDMDALYTQDAYSPATIAALENYGFCKEGEALYWIQGGRIDIGGELPFNVNGSQLAESYMVGWQNTCDAVRQLRNEAQERRRQIPNAEVIQCTYTGGLREHAGSLILRR